jgi:hypothetical protein
MKTLSSEPIVHGDAQFSACGRYRYTLSRRWCEGSPTVLFVMLNPSTADAERNDPTIRRCLAFAQNWGFGRLTVANLYALRATDPRTLWTAADPIGPENDAVIEACGLRAARILVGWGAYPRAHERAAAVLSLLPAGKLRCLGTTKDGDPRHPLYMPRDRRCEPFYSTPVYSG